MAAIDALCWRSHVPVSCLPQRMLLPAIVLWGLLGVAQARGERRPLDLWNAANIVTRHDPVIQLRATPDHLNTSGEWVTVSWTGVTQPNPETDIVAAYSPGNVNPLHTSPIKYKFATSDAQGNGQMHFRLINLRAEYAFAFFRNGTTHPILAAKSNLVRFTNYNEPLSIHLSLTGRHGEMRVTWSTRDKKSPKVLWGTQPGNYTFGAAATTTTYTRDEMCGGVANSTGWRDPGLFHHATLSRLQPGVRYYYVVGDVYGMSQEHSFAGPLPRGSEQSFGFFVIGDLGQLEPDHSLQRKEAYAASRNTTEAMAADLAEQELVLHIGDLSYARGHSFQWDAYFDQIAPIAQTIPWMTCPGNHESDWPGSGSFFTWFDSGGECGIPYERRHPMPAAPRKPWYSFDFGSVHFVMMSTEHDFRKGSEQWVFIHSDLASVNRAVTPWIIVLGHRPMYISSTNERLPSGDQPVARMLRAELEEVFFKYQVDAAFWGHHHSYQRTCPVRGESCVPPSTTGYAGPIHIVSGAAGASSSTNIQVPQPRHFAYVNCEEHGYTRARATPTSLQFDFVTGANRVVKDTITIPLPSDRLIRNTFFF